MQYQLFEPIKQDNKTCKTCKHLERWKYTHVTIYYCSMWKSNRTANNMLKVKANNPACPIFEGKK